MRASKYSPEFRERAVRLARESERPISAVARDLGVHPDSLRAWVQQAEADSGTRNDRLTTAEREELAALRREFIDAHRVRSGVEPICREIEVSGSAYWARKTRPPSARAQRAEHLLRAIRLV